jgi:hypothetical protein
MVPYNKLQNFWPIKGFNSALLLRRSLGVFGRISELFRLVEASVLKVSVQPSHSLSLSGSIRVIV